jgi:hypothetical protein
MITANTATTGHVTHFLKIQLTFVGHDFLDSVRDEVLWAKTKDGAAAAGAFSLELIKTLAKGFAKKQIEDKTGISLDL